MEKKKSKEVRKAESGFWLSETAAGGGGGKGNWCFGGKGGGVKINTDGNYRNRNAEDKKSHTHGGTREGGVKPRIHTYEKCTFTTK